ncbi:energy-coupling factor transport system ATP-binding protein [Alkalithermobacter thermoalcaliphilus JW-YL-7 = DSM 7308]|uniref:Energy-coupling factor transport system ATP-binding protein n=1 Tax=Alkalithermobacter thermoalcaliphilus JW-YL-7 = DSM 7308 TaxID=1121328 RepID=A0A150FN22_CLOPD|nr:Phosphonate-transporting ATPase [[Clostridium] paradoxum JW-YL-7 = DSM 7308]SHL24167.1 energy-coupling factor transport system ATP-binding protein [[Clostridium] paradoxum JW-YL-7 = DSM 7308]
MDNIIQVKDVVYEYSQEENSLKALDNVNLDIKKGEFVAIIGHNGSGKSTLAKHLNAILKPKHGNVIVAGINTKDEDKLWQIRQSAGMIFQNPDNQIVATVVEEDVAFGPENLGIDPEEIKIRVENSLKAVDMYEFRNKAPHLLSGGQKQRVAIAGIIAMKPDCIILDEATAMLDPSGRKEVMETITKLNKEEKITIIHITHFMEEAVEADKVIVMENGRIVMHGKPREIFVQVDKLKKLRLDVPSMTELAYELKKSGLNIDKDILTVDEMVINLCQYQ